MASPELRNIAIIAHVDHGKTTLVDAMLRQAGLFHAHQVVDERVMDRNDMERERGITILAKNASLTYDGVKINLVDTPGHADFGGEVERILRMVDGVLLLVDAAEGPMPQTRFVLEKSLALINKVDRADARIAEVEDEILELFLALDADDTQIEFPTLYGSGRDGYMGTDPEARAGDLVPLFRTIVDTVPPPRCDPQGAFQMLVANLEYSEYVGQQCIGRVERGRVVQGMPIKLLQADGGEHTGKVVRIDVFDGLGRGEVSSAEAGEIVVVAGLDDADIGDTLAHPNTPERLPALTVEPPTIEVEFRVNDSPFAGREGTYVTGRQLGVRLRREALFDRALRVGDSPDGDAFSVAGRGELHLAVLIEKLRREGYEFAVSRPQVLVETIDGKPHEPIEELICDLPEPYTGTVIERLGQRKGVLKDMRQSGDRARLTFTIPTRGLIGFRTEFLSATRGAGLLSHRRIGMGPYQGQIAQRGKGALVALEQAEAVPYALFQLADRGEFFISPGTPVYAGMIVGEYNKPGDLVINVGKTKKLTNVRASGSDDAVLLAPPRAMGLEQFLEFLNDDELIEVTPSALRARKRVLDHNRRKQAAKRAKA